MQKTYSNEIGGAEMVALKRRDHFKESFLSNLYSAKPRIANEKKQYLEKLCLKNLIPERYHSFYDSLEVTVGMSKKA